MLFPSAKEARDARLTRLFYALVLGACLAGGVEILIQRQDSRYVGGRAHAIVAEAGAATPLEKVLALRNYLRAHVDYHNLPLDHRPFFRATAAETLRSGRGYCG